MPLRISELIGLTAGMLGLCLTAPAAWGQLTARVEYFAVLPTGALMSVMTADPNHNAGLIAFNTYAPAGSGDRGNLYVALGDGGSGGDPQNNAQNAGNPYGAILRIDPLGNNSANGKYGIVAGNVFAADANPATLAENYAIGLRNPQRFGWDSQTGEMYSADIGQNAFEEINRGVNGGNYGWNVREGSQGSTLPGALDPVAAYDHSSFVTFPITGSRAITTGEVFRGTDIAGLNGNLLLGDFPNGVIYTLDVVNDPLSGGSSGLKELSLLDENGQIVRMIDLLRQTTGNANLRRVDLRFSLGLPGEVFLLNKHDGIVRRLVAVPEPAGFTGFALAVADWAGRRSCRKSPS
jgi:glucose/arabinose dehydrogenase